MGRILIILAAFLFLSLNTTLSPELESSDLRDLNIVLIGDTGKNNNGQLRVAESMQRLCSQEPCDMGILAGDIVYPVGVKSRKDPILEKVFDRYYNPLNIPFLMALGNHDYGRLYINFKRPSYQLLHAKKNPRFHMPYYWYMHETPFAVFAVIDTTRLMWRRSIKAQARMIKEAEKLARSKNKWFMVVGHHPYLSNGPHGNAGHYERMRFPFFVSGKYVKRFVNTYVCGKADFYLSGHDHSLQVMDGKQAKCNTRLIVSGSAATATRLSARNEVKFETLDLGFFHLAVSQNEVRLRAFNDNTQLLYEENFSKARNYLARSR